MFANIKIFTIITLLCVVFSFFIPVFFVQAEASGQPDLQAVDAFLVKQVAANRIPGLAVAIVKDGRIIFEKGYGESRPGQPVTPQTQFYIGSVTKSFTALAALQLVEEGKLELDAPVQKYLPWFRVADPEASRVITLRHLLTHTSGLSEPGDPNVSVFTDNLEEQAHLMSQAQLTAPVGSQFQYYNQNYRLAGLLIEKASGQSFDDYLAENILMPLGMDKTITNPEDASDLAQGYSRWFGFPLARTQKFNPGGVSSGYMISTAEDMARYLIAQLDNARPDGTQLLQTATLKTMRTPPAGVESEVGMGWIVAEGGNTLAYAGAVEYFQAVVVMGLKERTGLVILFNQNSLENMAFENNVIRDGLLALLNGKTPTEVSYGWIGWVLLALAAADLCNHARLFRMLPRWMKKIANQPPAWVWVKVLAGMLFPLAVVIGVPLLANATFGGAPNWIEPFGLIPDLISWLLVGLGLNFIRSLIHAVLLLHRGGEGLQA